MLVYLKVQNLAVVEKVVLHFGAGFNVLTGETGAGKSILIDALSLLLSKRLPREGQRDPAQAIVVEALFSEGEEETVLRREINAGRSLCFVNDESVPFARLQTEAADWLNIYGQRDHLYLLESGNHLSYLDQYCGIDLPLNELKRAYDEAKGAMAVLEGVKTEARGAETRRELLGFQIRELQQMGLRRGEEEELESKVKIMGSAEDIVQKTSSMLNDFYDGERSVYTLLARHAGQWASLRELFPGEGPLFDDLERFYQTMPDLVMFLRRLGDTVEYDEQELNSMQERLSRLASLKKKHSATLDGLIDRLDLLQREFDHLENLDFSILEADRAAQKSLDAYARVHVRCREVRQRGALRLAEAVTNELKGLAMPKGEFRVQFDIHEPSMVSISPTGCDEIEFYFSSNPGQPAGPIREIASGGELSRLMLILKALAPSEDKITYVFDEIDTGVGGKTAEFVGARLKEIARQHQVLCISHLPQIAACAGTHFLVEKRFEHDQTFSSVRSLTEGERIEEMARLMAGSSGGESVRQAAKDLLRSRQES
jgi:DNA repair protein RecN (Recombination protein N)